MKDVGSRNSPQKRKALIGKRGSEEKKTFIEAHMGTLKTRGDLYNDTYYWVG